ncbi:MAG: 3'-5' exonuclease [Clostridiales bacterium]|nr:3'-5' exonuclease [Clostridiales bacterium]
MTDTTFKQRWLGARRKIIEHDFAKLNPEQRLAVMATEGPLLLLAGAGSGKTTVIINRIANLIRYGKASDCDEIDEHATEDELEFLERYAEMFSPEDAEKARALAAYQPADPWRIMAITFTNKAADELKSRLEAMLGEAANDVWASTFHSACVRILRKDIDRLGIFSSSFTIYDTADCLSLIKHILKDLELDEKKFSPRSILSVISGAKDEMISAEEFLSAAGSDPWRKTIGQVYKEYTARMIDSNALDFDDLILYTVKLFTECGEVLEFYQNKFRYLLVDEYQDTNMLQYKFVSLLAEKRRNICVVGDDDQGIYKFRGATIENILSFEKQYHDCRVIRLEQNYRSTEYILEASNAVIRRNTNRKGKELWTNNGRGEKLTLYVAANENDEAQFVAAKILAGFSQGANWSDFAVLYRMNAQSNQLEHAFKRQGIPYKVFGGMKFYDRAEIKDMLAYMCVVNNPDDDLRLRRIINNPPRGIGDKTLDTAAELAAAEGISLFSLLRKCRDYPELQRSAAKLLLFVNMIDDLRSEVSERNLDELYELILSKSGYLAALEAKDTQEDQTRAENVRELKTNIVNFIKERSGVGNLADFLDEMALYTDLDQLEKDADSAVMMTMHSAKGLEFPTVFIVGAEEGIFPGTRSIGDPDEIEEERRLCYVGMTRAKEKLYLTAAKQRMLFGRTSCNSVSRFVKEIPEDCLDTVHGIRNVSSYQSTGGIYQQGSGGYRSSYSEKAPSAPSSKYSVTAEAPPAPAASAVTFRKGDSIVHKAFGPGVISTMQEMGGDFLVEIIFDKVGTKRLMLKSASQYMKKA